MNQLLSLALGAMCSSVLIVPTAEVWAQTDPCGDGCGLAFEPALQNTTVECPEDLPTDCDALFDLLGIAGVEALNTCSGDPADVQICFPLVSEAVAQPLTSCLATTAKRDGSLGDGEYGPIDGAVRVYGLMAMGLADSDYFVEDPENPLTFEHAPDSRSARLTGTVHCVLNENQIFHVDARFVNEDNALDWLAEDPLNALLIADDPEQPGYAPCAVDTGAISVFDLQVMSRLVGAGDYQGTLFIDHMPSSYSKRFQLGDGANNHNCNPGLGGWFRWSGTLNGQEVSGLSGDIVVDLACESVEGVCDEQAEFLFEALDSCGEIVTQSVLVDRVDTQAPVVLSGADDMVVSCDAVPPMAAVEDLEVSDNCSGDITVSEGLELIVAGELCPQSYLIERRWTLSDVCGNTAVHIQHITVEDVEAPMLEAPLVVEVPCELWPDNTAYATASDNCGEVTLTFEDLADDAGGCTLPTGQYLRTYTATDECGNVSTIQQTMLLVDHVAPEFDFVPENYTAQCDDDLPVVMATATDNCSGASVSMVEEVTPGDCPASWSVTRTFTAIDNCGNETSAIQSIEVVDTEAPLLSLPADYTLECGETLVEEDATATDNCGEVEISVSSEVILGDCVGQYQVLRTFTAVDACGNASSGMQTISVIDTTPPVFTSVPEDYTAECSDAHPMGDATAQDVCSDVSLTVSTETLPGACPQAYTLIRTFTATDECGNQSQAVQTIQIVDTTAPEWMWVPVDYTAECSDDHPLEAAQASDNCGVVTMEIDADTLAGACPQAYTVIRTFTATDDCGNATTATQTIHIVDTTAPSLTLEPEVILSCEDYPTSALFATAEDACDGASITFEDVPVSGGCVMPYGAFIRTYTATDACGNSSTAEQILTIVDDVAPVFDVVPLDVSVACGEEVVLEDASAYDNCSSVELSLAVDTLWGDCEGSFDVVRTWTALDQCDNASTATQTISVYDDQAPVFTIIPADYTLECLEDPVFEEAYAIDNCSSLTLTESLVMEQGGCEASYTLVRTITAMDACGNASSVVQTIQVVDLSAPSFTFVPADQTVQCTEEIPFDVPMAEDACSEFSLTWVQDTLDSGCGHVFDLVRTWTATDACGNSSEVSQVISVVDSEAPQVTFACGLTNGEVVEVCCESLNGLVMVPEACEIAAVDNCQEVPNVALTETYSGEFAPTETVDRWCVITDPQPLASGETCDNFAPMSVHLYSFPGASMYNTLHGTVAHHVDGTMTYSMEVVAMNNPNAGWTMTLRYSAPMSWEEWIDQPGAHSYKSDCGLGDHTTWEYAMMEEGTALGWGEYEGSELTLMHQPVNGYFGFQIGEGANNKNENYGFSGWFYLNGTFQGAPVMASGDVFGELDCCQPWTLERLYEVSDCAGNLTTFGYEVHMTGLACVPDEEDGIEGASEDASLVTPKDLIQINDLMPNPASDMVQFTLLAEEVGPSVQVVLTTMSGTEVMEIYQGDLVAGWPTPVMFDASGLDVGMYQLRLTAKNFLTTRKLMVVH